MRSALVLGVLLAFGGGCGSAAGESAAPPPLPNDAAPSLDPIEGGPAPLPPPPPPPASSINEQRGVFVSARGSDAADGTRARPFATIARATEKAKADKKSIFACAETYVEPMVITDGVSMSGNLDCSFPEWKLTAAHAKIASPVSPAARATDIVTPTRVDGFDIIAPDATAPSGSSIGLIANNASALTISNSKLYAGNGKKGDAGVEAIQLVLSGYPNGGPGAPQQPAGGVPIVFPSVGAGGVSACIGAAGHDGGRGGAGGSGGAYVFSGGTWKPIKNVQLNTFFDADNGASGSASAAGGVIYGANATDGASGVAGTPGASASGSGTFGPDGYRPNDGARGTDGSPGAGAGGGAGYPPAGWLNEGDRYTGATGGGGGGGGCPGLAGTPGKGGGASIAVLAIDSSTLTFEKSVIEASRGGDGGEGTFGSLSTLGGAGGAGNPSNVLFSNGAHGGQGGPSGTSGHGGGGPSIGVAHNGGGPNLVSTTITEGVGGTGVTAAIKGEKTIAPSFAGTSAAVYAF